MTPHPRNRPSGHRSRYGKNPGFTLTELLVVIVIVAVLATLVFLGYRRLRAAGDKAMTINNLKQLQTANMLYAEDHNGRYVSSFSRNEDGKLTGQWDRNREFLQHLIGDSAERKLGRSEVPVKMLDPVAYRGRGKNYDMLRGSYGMPEAYGVSYGAPGADSHLSMARITAAERTAAFVTAIDWHVTYGGRFRWDGTEGPVGRGITAYRHNNKALVAYYDGHVGEISKADMKKIDESGGEEHPFWKAYQ
jgi:prepilin-type N-terminal cleavage/methylation domain-containing protein/prepilin-type processing-associated H-X9-DG protein